MHSTHYKAKLLPFKRWDIQMPNSKNSLYKFLLEFIIKTSLPRLKYYLDKRYLTLFIRSFWKLDLF